MGRKLTAKSKQFSTILKLSRESFLNILKKNPQDFERFCEIKDKILLNSDFSSLKQQCKLCQSSQHFESACPTSHLIRESPFVYARFNFSAIQERNSAYDRQGPFKFNPYENRQDMQDKAELFQKNYELLPQENNDEINEDKQSIEDDGDYYNNYGSSNDDEDNSKATYTTNQDKDMEYPPSPEQQIIQVVSKFSLLNGFTLDDKTRKTSLSVQKHDFLPQSPGDSQKNYPDDTVSLNIPTSQNNTTNTPKALTRGTTMYQSSAERTEFSAYIKELNNIQDTIKELEQHQKEMLKRRRKSKIQEDTRKRFSMKTDYSKKKLKTSSVLKKSSYYDKDNIDLDKQKTYDHKFVSIHNDITNYEKLVANSLWNLDSIRIFTNYFPNGNYTNAINRFNQLRKKYLKKINSNNNNNSDKQQRHPTIKKKYHELK